LQKQMKIVLQVERLYKKKVQFYEFL